MAKIIGLTGGIGSGKTTVANLFQALGVPVYIADQHAKRITESEFILKAIRHAFGDDVFDGPKLNREALAGTVFNDAERLKKLNAIIHPAVRADFRQWVSNNASSPILIKETAILFESGNDKDCDAIITVTAPLELRITRVLNRDKSTREDILKRIENQWSDAQRTAKSDYVIDNTSLTNIEKQVKEILKKLQNF